MEEDDFSKVREDGGMGGLCLSHSAKTVFACAISIKIFEFDLSLYTSDAADEEDSVDLGGRRIIKKKKKKQKKKKNQKKRQK